MRSLILILLFTLIFVSQINTIVDIDLWWNLKSGEYIVKNLDIPRTDIFSYTFENHEWIDHAWLSQILLYLVFTKFGWVGLNILKALIICLCFFILFKISSKNRKIIYPLFFTLLGILAFGYRSFVRPEIFSYLFLCIFLYILEDEKRIYILPILQILWVNMHGYFILGPVVIFLYCIGEFFSAHREKARRLAVVFIGTCLMLFINPNFYKGALYPLGIFMDVFSSQKIYMQDVHELMMPIRSGFGRYVFFWIFAITSSITFIINLKKAGLKHGLLFLASFFAAYIAIRNMPIFIFIAMPLASINLNEASLTKNIDDKKYYIPFVVIICSMIYFFLSNNYYAFVNQSILRKTGSNFARLLMVDSACDFLERNNIKGRIFNTMDFGPYIGYRFYPQRRIFIDTRTDLYKDDFYELYRKAQNYPSEWNKVQKRYDFNIALIRHLFGGTERLLRYLYSNDRWSLVYYDENSAIFLHDVPENKDVIERFRIDFRKKKLEDKDININIARFFEKIGEKEFTEEIYMKLLEKRPRFLEAGNNLIAIYINSRRFDEALRVIERFLQYYPKSAELYANMATAYLRMGKRDQGILMLEKSARLNPYLRQASYMLGLVYLEKGYIEKALRQFTKYVRLDPYNPEVHRILGDIYKQKGLLNQARLEYNEADRLEGRYE